MKPAAINAMEWRDIICRPVIEIAFWCTIIPLGIGYVITTVYADVKSTIIVAVINFTRRNDVPAALRAPLAEFVHYLGYF